MRFMQEILRRCLASTALVEIPSSKRAMKSYPWYVRYILICWFMYTIDVHNTQNLVFIETFRLNVFITSHVSSWVIESEPSLCACLSVCKHSHAQTV